MRASRSITLLFVYIQYVQAFWRMAFANGAGLVSERVDPIVNPDSLSAHSHIIYSSSNFGSKELTTKDLQAGDCSTAPVKQDMSAYWFPNLYFAFANGSFASVGVTFTVYYFYPDDGSAEPFPEDFTNIGGDPTRRTFDPSEWSNQAVKHKCLQADGPGNLVEAPELPAYYCGQIRGQVTMPHCGNGKPKSDNPLKMDHISYPSNPGTDWKGEAVEDGITCPDTHPIHYPRVFFELIWETAPFKDSWSDAYNTSQPFVYATGDATGYSLHADFVNGWNTETLNDAVKNCNKATNPEGNVQDCTAFEIKPEGDYCFKTPDVDEQVLGVIDYLPGCHQYGANTDTSKCNKRPDLLSPSTAYEGPPGTSPPAGACAIGSDTGGECQRSESSTATINDNIADGSQDQAAIAGQDDTTSTDEGESSASSSSSSSSSGSAENDPSTLTDQAGSSQEQSSQCKRVKRSSLRRLVRRAFRTARK